MDFLFRGIARFYSNVKLAYEAWSPALGRLSESSRGETTLWRERVHGAHDVLPRISLRGALLSHESRSRVGTRCAPPRYGLSCKIVRENGARNNGGAWIYYLAACLKISRCKQSVVLSGDSEGGRLRLPVTYHLCGMRYTMRRVYPGRVGWSGPAVDNAVVSTRTTAPGAFCAFRFS